MAYYVVEIDGVKYRINTQTLEIYEIKDVEVVSYPKKEELLVKAFDILRKENKPI